MNTIQNNDFFHCTIFLYISTITPYIFVQFYKMNIFRSYSIDNLCMTEYTVYIELYTVYSEEGLQSEFIY